MHATEIRKKISNYASLRYIVNGHKNNKQFFLE